jgi:hypothetical protein
MRDSNYEEVTSGVREALDQIGVSSRRLFDEVVKSAGQYGRDSLDYAAGGLGSNLMDAVKREPMVAIAGAFAVGFLAAKFLRRVSRHDEP